MCLFGKTTIHRIRTLEEKNTHRKDETRTKGNTPAWEPSASWSSASALIHGGLVCPCWLEEWFYGFDFLNLKPFFFFSEMSGETHILNTVKYRDGAVCFGLFQFVSWTSIQRWPTVREWMDSISSRRGPLIALPIVLATDYPAIQSVWVTFILLLGLW